MADNIAVTEGSGKNVATDDVGGKQYQRIKLDLGTDGAAAPALAGAGAVATGVQRVTLASDDPAVAKLGTIDTDTGVIAGDTTSIDGKITACNTGAIVISSGTVTTVSTVSAVTSLDKSVYVDDADWTDDTSSHTLVGGVYQSSPHTVTDGDVSPFGVDVNGNIVLGTGAKAIGKLAANTGVDIGDVDVTSVIAGVGATNLGKARDSALGATDTGVMALAVRDDTLTTLTPADGDYVPLRVSSTGQLHVTGAGGGTEYTEDVASANPIVGSAVMMERDDALGALTPVEGDWAALRCDANGALWVHDNVVNTLLGTIDADTGAIKIAVEALDNAVDGNYLNCNLNIAGTDCVGNAGVLAAGVLRVTIATDDECNNFLGTIDADTGAIKTATELIDDAIYIDDADWSDGSSKHILVGGLYQSTPQTVTDGDVAPLEVDVNGCLILGTSAKAIGKLAANTGVDIGDVDVTSIVPGVAATNLGKAEDAAHSSGDVGVAAMTVRANTATSLSGADNDYQPLITNTNGCLHTTDANITACNTGAVVISSGTVTTVSTVTNLAQLGGTAITMDEGVHDAGCQRVTIATDDDGVAHLATIAGDTTAIETAVEIMDDWDAVHDSAASSDGPQLMGAYDSTKPTAVGDGDAVRILADAYGRLLAGVEPQRFQAVYDSADATGEGEAVHASAASTIIVVQSYIISSDVEGWIKLQEEDSTALTGKFWLKAGGGVAITLPDKAPIVLGVDSDLEVICEAAGNVSVSVTGYTIPG